MNRKIAAFSFVVLAALALSGIAASAVSAANNTHHITASETWVPTFSALTSQQFRSTTESEFPRYECEEIAASVTEHIPTTTDEITVTPAYEGCKAFNGETEATAFLENNGCDYTFTTTTTEGNPTGGEHASLDIDNHIEPGQPCEIETRVTVFKFKCLAIPNQEIADALRYEHDEDNIIITFTAHNIINTTINSIACPTASGENEVHADGSLTGDVTVEGSTTVGVKVPLTLSTLVTEK